MPDWCAMGVVGRALKATACVAFPAPPQLASCLLSHSLHSLLRGLNVCVPPPRCAAHCGVAGQHYVTIVDPGIHIRQVRPRFHLRCSRDSPCRLPMALPTSCCCVLALYVASASPSLSCCIGLFHGLLHGSTRKCAHPRSLLFRLCLTGLPRVRSGRRAEAVHHHARRCCPFSLLAPTLLWRFGCVRLKVLLSVQPGSATTLLVFAAMLAVLVLRRPLTCLSGSIRAIAGQTPFQGKVWPGPTTFPGSYLLPTACYLHSSPFRIGAAPVLHKFSTGAVFVSARAPSGSPSSPFSTGFNEPPSHLPSR